MKLTLTQQITLDGVIQAPGGPEEDPSDGFPHGGWSFPFFDEELGAYNAELLGRADAYLLGRRTYDIFAAYWPLRTDPADTIAGPLNSRPKYVASRTLKSADWAGTQIIGGSDLVKDVTALKERPGGELQIHGSAALAAFLLGHGLIDTVRLLTCPVVLGTGKRLFTDRVLPATFRLAESRAFAKGVVFSTYELAGRPTYGTFE
ncbi:MULTISPECIES: dihydrofolate reductase family protein [unclassified Streptomyces]|uniref:dihydrofolate reductase family protein n=1 Tax=unclassified Streptomyces TaxID=2593676 RepID=UPI00278BFED6|nr:MULTISPECIES: dihydrofolate reductase family protein [unclassified Streptomyces]